MMRCISYAGDHVITTNDVAGVLVELMAALADRGRAQVVKFPVIVDGASTSSMASMVLGGGVGMLTVEHAWEWEEPDFGFSARQLQRTLEQLTPTAVFAEPGDLGPSFVGLFDEPSHD
ncbi:hypothetical protein ACFJGV_15230 [Cnuibacter sp. UC19_7]|uniref:hypothetical protein n=1 Tax=Cnuibacter sp. UC19_7 TaxID=3350166 RepID=UPI003672BE12